MDWFLYWYMLPVSMVIATIAMPGDYVDAQLMKLFIAIVFGLVGLLMLGVTFL